MEAVLQKIAAALFSAALLVPADPLPAADRTVIVSVPGIPGPYCAYGVEKRLYELDGVHRVVPVWEKEQIRILIKDGETVTSEQIRAAFERSEYPYDYKILGR